MFSLHRILNAVNTISGEHVDIASEFERTFRNLYSSLDINVLFSGQIPVSIVANVIRASLTKTSEFAADKFRQTGIAQYHVISTLLSNPLLDETIEVIVKHTCVVKEKRTKALKKDAKTIALARAFQALSTDEVDWDNIAATLLQRDKSIHPFDNSFHTHINCMDTTCRFCTQLFTDIHLTKCVGHRKCNPVGYYPHVGVSLWNIIKSRHRKGLPYQLKERDSRPGELKALRFYLATPTSPPIVDSARENKAGSSRLRTKPMDWNEEVEREELARNSSKRRKQ